jgi:hypothetical protein
MKKDCGGQLFYPLLKSCIGHFQLRDLWRLRTCHVFYSLLMLGRTNSIMCSRISTEYQHMPHQRWLFCKRMGSLLTADKVLLIISSADMEPVNNNGPMFEPQSFALKHRRLVGRSIFIRFYGLEKTEHDAGAIRSAEPLSILPGDRGF